MIVLRFRTPPFAPPSVITLRTSRNGWQDIAGTHDGGGWTFQLDPAVFTGEFEFKFVLDGNLWSVDPNLARTGVDGETIVVEPGDVRFPLREPVPEYGQVQRLYFETSLAGEGEPFDVVVVGSGIGGGVVADQLADLGHRVLVLEAGGYLFPTHTGNLPRRQHARRTVVKHIWELWDDFKAIPYEKLPGDQYEGGCAYNLGGRSIFWGAFIPRMTSWELDFWGREVKWALEDVYYQRAEDVLGRSVQPRTMYGRQVFQFLRDVLPEFNHLDAPVSAQENFAGANTIPAGVFSTADLLMESALSDDEENRLQIRLNHFVERVAENGELVQVTARDVKTGEMRTFTARHAILAAGTLESARLALRSGLAPAELVGRGFTDHPIYFFHFRIPRASDFFEPYNSVKILSQPREKEGMERPPFNVLLEINSDFNQGRYLDDDLLKRILKERQDEVLGEIVFLLNADLLEGNRVTLSQDGAARPQTFMERVGVDPAVEAQIREILRKVVGGLGGVVFNEGVAGLGGVAHEVGTLRMERRSGKDEPLPGVVDENLRFVGHPRIHACDLSVFPTSPAANPTLTLAALAVRLADHLHSELGTGNANFADPAAGDGTSNDGRLNMETNTGTGVGPGLDAGLVGHWRFDEDDGDRALDSSGNANEGRLINVRRGDGAFKGSVEIGGGFDSHVTIPGSPTLNSIRQQVTVAARVFPRTLRDGFTVVVSRQVGDLLHPDQFFLGFGPENGGLHYKWHLGAESGDGDCYEGTPDTGRWMYLVGTYDGAVMRLFVDGVELGSRPLTGNLRADDNPVTIGGEENNPVQGDVENELDGYVDDVRIYNRALSAAEVAELSRMYAAQGEG